MQRRIIFKKPTSKMWLHRLRIHLVYTSHSRNKCHHKYQIIASLQESCITECAVTSFKKISSAALSAASKKKIDFQWKSAISPDNFSSSHSHTDGGLIFKSYYNSMGYRKHILSCTYINNDINVSKIKSTSGFWKKKPRKKQGFLAILFANIGEWTFRFS